MALGLTQPLTEISIKKMFLGSRARPALNTDIVTAACLDNVGSSTSHNPLGLHGLLQR
jgi:hypothetical protein